MEQASYSLERDLLIDSNIFIEFLRRRKRWQECGLLLTDLVRGKRMGHVTRFALHSIAVNLSAKQDSIPTLQKFTKLVRDAKGLHVIHTDLADDQHIYALMQETKLDFDDALQLYAATEHNLAIVSFDHDFDNFSRCEPRDILGLETVA